MAIDRDDFFVEFAGHATATVLGLMKNYDCTLTDITFARADGSDWMSITFTRDRYPGRVFTFRRGFFQEGFDPQMSANSAAGVLMGSLMEAINRPVREIGPDEDVTVDLNRR